MEVKRRLRTLRTFLLFNDCENASRLVLVMKQTGKAPSKQMKIKDNFVAMDVDLAVSLWSAFCEREAYRKGKEEAEKNADK